MLKNILMSFVYLLSATASFANEYKADDIIGYWLTEESTAVVQIFKDGEQYGGKLVWLRKLHLKEEKEIFDKENPDEALRTRKVLGLQNLSGFTFDGESKWTGGKIYDPKKGKTYSAKMHLEEEGKVLELRGYVGIPLFGRSATWTRQAQVMPEEFRTKK